jgi:hypothetical protein
MRMRLIRCLSVAVVGGAVAFALWFGVGIALMWHLPDGQAGMGAALGAVFLGGPAGALLGYGFEYWRSGRDRA